MLTQLVDKSLVEASETNGAMRYRLLETLRQYGQERLAARGEAEATHGRHAAYYLALAQTEVRALYRGDQVARVERLEAEHDTFRAALRWAVESHEAELGLRLAGALGAFWFTRSRFSEGRWWLDAALSTAGAASGPPSPARGTAQLWAGRLAHTQGDIAAAEACFTESLAIHKAVGDRQAVMATLHYHGVPLLALRDNDRAEAAYAERLAVARELGRPLDVAHSLIDLASVASAHGEADRVSALCAEGLAIFRELGNQRGVVVALNTLGHAARRRGDRAQAAACYGESLAILRELGDTLGSFSWRHAFHRYRVALSGYRARGRRRLPAGSGAVRREPGPVPPTGT